MSLTADEPFRLVAPVASPRLAAMEKVRQDCEERRRVIAREPDHEAFFARAWVVTANTEVVDVHDPQDGATLDDLIDTLCDRMEEAPTARSSAQRWWARDLCIWRSTALLAAICRSRQGRPVVTRFDK
jgi:hypothetical protein